MKYIALLFFILFLSFSCRHSNHSVNENEPIETSSTDDYALLKGQPITSPRISEDLSGKVIILTEKDFKERITALDNPKGFQYLGQTPCIVQLYADWCRPCGYQSELMNMLAPEYQGNIIFYKLNVDRAYDVRTAFNVESIPMMLFLKPRGPITTSVGFLNKEKLTTMINELLLN